MYSRRSFLKLAGTAAAGALLVPRLQALPAQGARAIVSPGLSQPWPQGPDVKLGRGTLGWGAPILSRPHPEGAQLGYVYPDDVVHILREVVGLGMAFHTHVWFELEQGYVYSTYLQPVMNLPQTPLTTVPPDGVWTEVVTPYVDARALPDPKAKKVYRIYYSAVYQIAEVVAGADGQPWYRVAMETQETMYAPAQVFRVITADEITPLSPNVDPNEKKVSVYLADQALSAFEGTHEVFRARISSGANYFGPDGHTLVNGTPGGAHPIWQKRISRHMQGGTVDNGYDVPGVGWVSYFSSNGAALHSTYWHNDFGIPKSHGCLNCRPDDAKWLFRWTAPTVTYQPGDITVDWDHRGTMVELLETS
jgi:lipoprotein-anchoring transpeptidase ErfK/SrfK